MYAGVPTHHELPFDAGILREWRAGVFEPELLNGAWLHERIKHFVRWLVDQHFGAGDDVRHD